MAVASRMCKLASFAVIATLALLGSVYCDADEGASTPQQKDPPGLGGQHKLNEKEHLLKAIYHIMQGAKLDMKHLHHHEHHEFGPWKHIEHSHPTSGTADHDHYHPRLHSIQELVPKLREAVLQIIAIVDRAIEEDLLTQRMMMDLDTYIPDILLTLDQVEVAADYHQRYQQTPPVEPSSGDVLKSEQASTQTDGINIPEESKQM